MNTRHIGPVTIGRTDTRRRSCTFGGPSRIITPLISPDPQGLLKELKECEGEAVDLVEWRVDYMLEQLMRSYAMPQTGVLQSLSHPLDNAHGVENMERGSVEHETYDDAHHAADTVESILVQTATTLVEHSHLPVLATIRTRDEGGQVALDIQSYSRYLPTLASVCDAVDVEIMRSGSTLIDECHRAGARVVASAHFFEGTPPLESIEEIFASMDWAGADILKIAAMPLNARDTINLMTAQVDASERYARPVITIAMGPLGMVTRICGEPMYSAATFATVKARSAPGQLSVAETRRILNVLEDGEY